MANSTTPTITKIIENINCSMETGEKFDHVMYLYEALIKTLASFSFGWLRNSGKSEERINQIISTEFAKPSLGSWTRLLRECFVFINQDSTSIYKSFFEKKPSLNGITRAYNEMTQYFTMKQSNRASVSLDMLFDSYVSFRNKATGHGALNLDMKKYFSPILYAAIEEIETHYNEYTNGSFVNFSQIIIDETNKNTTIHRGIKYKGNLRESFELTRTVLNTMEQNKIYYETTENILVNLYPFIMLRNGNFYFMNGISGKKMEYLSYSIGDRFYEDMQTDDFEKYLRINAFTVSFYEQRIQTQLSETGVVHNLPRFDFDFIGRNKDKEKLLETISNRRHSIIALDGIGGVGKTALTLKVANKLSKLDKNDKNRFNYIIWVSAKQTRLTVNGIEKVEASFGLLDDLLNLIANISGFEYLTKENFEDKKSLIKEILSMDSFLLIVDNFETVKQAREIWEFLRDELPMPSMSLITSRHILAEVSRLLEVRQMETDDARDLIIAESERLGLKEFTKNSTSDIEKIISKTGAIPLAIKQIIGHMALGKSLATAIKDLTTISGNILDFCFNESYAMMDKDCRSLFLTLAKVEKPIRRDGLEMITELKGDNLADVVSKLLKMSLIEVTLTEDGTQVFNMLPLTEEFASKKLESEPEIFSQIFKRLEEFEELHSLNFILPSKELELTNIEKMVQAALTFASRRDFEKADNWFTKAIELDRENFYILLNKAQYEQYYKLDFNAARETYDKITKINRDDFMTWFHWGMLEKQQDNLSEAIKKFDKSLLLNPEHVFSNHGKGDCLLKIGIRRKEALKQHKDKSNTKNLPHKNEIRKLIYDSVVSLQRGFFSEPKTKMENHHNAVNHHTLSVAYSRIGEMDKAMEECIAGLSIEPFNKKLQELKKNIVIWSQINN